MPEKFGSAETWICKTRKLFQTREMRISNLEEGGVNPIDNWKDRRPKRNFVRKTWTFVGSLTNKSC
jgi:hypothetical protein